MAELKTFRIHVSAHYSHTIECGNKEKALQMAWDDIKDYFRYGWKSWEDFRENVRVEEI